MIQKSAKGSISLHRDPKVTEGNSDGRFTLEGLEEFCSEARMAGIGDKNPVGIDYQHGSVDHMFFTTTDQFVIQAQGKTVVYKTNALPYVLAFALLVLAVVGWIL